MTPLVIQYPLDPTGVNPNNLVQNEPHALIANRTFRAIAPNYGGFFTASLKVYDAANGQLLTDGSNGTVQQYYACEYYELPSERYGQEICAIIMITDPAVSNNVTINYQTLGGPYGTSAQAIIQMIDALGLDNRPVAWGDIIGKPSEFPPSKHLHDIGDVYGFEYVVHALDRIRDAIEIGDQASHDIIYAYIDTAIAQLQGTANGIQAQLTAHVNDFDNPHRVSASQLNVYTIPQADAITNAISLSLANHVGNTANPHNTTAAQVGAWTIAQTQAAIAAAIATVTLGFTPVQQGGGVSQGNNKVKLGWDGTRLRATVDSTDLGGLIAQTEFNNNIANLQNQINGKAPNGPYAQTGVNQSVSFWDIFANGTMFSANDIWAFNSDGRLKHRFGRIKDALKKVKAVWGIVYQYTPQWQLELGMEDRDYQGFIAQQVQKVCPEIVGLAPFDRDPVTGKSKSGKNYLTIQYDKYCALLNEAIRESDLKLDILLEHLGLKDAVEGAAQQELDQLESEINLYQYAEV
jgi:hypothetical protein